jgi:hypothetical protein
MKFILELLGQSMADIHGVDVRVLAAGHANAGTRRAKTGTGTAEVPTLCSDLREDGLELIGLGAEPYKVASRPMQVREAAAMLVPNIAQLFHCLGGVEEA